MYQPLPAVDNRSRNGHENVGHQRDRDGHMDGQPEAERQRRHENGRPAEAEQTAEGPGYEAGYQEQDNIDEF